MGEIAEMMLDGDMCECCGEMMSESGDGYPRKCAGCQFNEKAAPVNLAPKQHFSKITCQICNKKVSIVGIGNHLKDSHGWK